MSKFSLSTPEKHVKIMSSTRHRNPAGSAAQNTATKSGSRPMAAKYPIPVSSPSHPQHLDSRHVKSALK